MERISGYNYYIVILYIKALKINSYTSLVVKYLYYKLKKKQKR